MFSKGFFTKEAINKLSKTMKIKQNINRCNLIYKTGNKKKEKTYDFKKFETIRSS